jgi:hypothetical protein
MSCRSENKDIQSSESWTHATGRGLAFSVPNSSSLVFMYAGKLINAWTETLTKWFLLPLAVGALL